MADAGESEGLERVQKPRFGAQFGHERKPMSWASRLKYRGNQGCRAICYGPSCAP